MELLNPQTMRRLVFLLIAVMLFSSFNGELLINKRKELVMFINPEPEVLSYNLEDDGQFPNNASLPLVVMKNAIRLPDEDPASVVEDIFNMNRWGNSWRDGLYRVHHYHSTAHEVLGVYSGWVEGQFGGENGIKLKVFAGDVIIIPAGVAHKNINQSLDFKVVGAYPPGHKWDMNYGNPEERPKTDQNIANVPLPPTDPVYGKEGKLLSYWK